MSDELIQKLRKVAESSKLEHKWLYKLTDSQLVDIYNLIRSGKLLVEIPDTVVDNWGIDVGISKQQMVSDLANFKLKALDDVALAVAQQRAGDPRAGEIASRLNKLSTKVDAMGRLGWLIDLQTERVQSLTESKDSRTIHHASEAVRELGLLLEKYIRLESEVESGKITMRTSVSGSILDGLQEEGRLISEAATKLLTMTKEITIEQPQLTCDLPEVSHKRLEVINEKS
jgi:hypothetical protein